MVGNSFRHFMSKPMFGTGAVCKISEMSFHFEFSVSVPLLHTLSKHFTPPDSNYCAADVGRRGEQPMHRTELNTKKAFQAVSTSDSVQLYSLRAVNVRGYFFLLRPSEPLTCSSCCQVFLTHAVERLLNEEMLFAAEASNFHGLQILRCDRISSDGNKSAVITIFKNKSC